MFYLIAAIFCSTVISLSMRLSENYRKNHISMLAVNYLTCLVLCIFYTGGGIFSAASNLTSPDYLYSLLLGAIQGFLYMVSFLLLQVNISRNGIVLSGTFMRLGLLVPTVCAILFFGEQPTTGHILGFILGILAILLINLEKGERKVSSGFMLVLLLLGGGLVDVMAKIYEETGSEGYKNEFLLFTFLVALIICLVVTIIKKESLCPADILWGIIIGIPNYYSARFLLGALKTIPAIVVYPTHSGATISLITTAGVLFFKETLSKRRIIAMGIIIAALLLLNQ